jgi:hypothetical protein
VVGRVLVLPMRKRLVKTSVAQHLDGWPSHGETAFPRTSVLITPEDRKQFREVVCPLNLYVAFTGTRPVRSVKRYSINAVAPCSLTEMFRSDSKR